MNDTVMRLAISLVMAINFFSGSLPSDATLANLGSLPLTIWLQTLVAFAGGWLSPSLIKAGADKVSDMTGIGRP